MRSDSLPSGRGLPWLLLLGLAAVAGLAYLPSQFLAFIADDYVQIRLARQYGAVSDWPALAADPLYRCRATSLVLTYWTERLFGLSPQVFNLSSLVVHILNTSLVFALGVWRPIGFRLSAAAAAFFAVAEGHQEAVIWYAALPELLVFTFVLGAFVLWVRWLQSPKAIWYAGALGAYLLALLSKESAVCLVGLLALTWWLTPESRRRIALGMLPFAAAAVLYFVAAYVARSSHLHFNDGTFSLNAPFLLTLANSTGRLLWIWGLAALLVLAALDRARLARMAAIALPWIVVTFLPYSFLTYMPRVPSRHTYLASAGAALLVGAAFLALRNAGTARLRLAAAAAAGLMFVHNIGYLWLVKHPQYVQRAAATSALLDYARTHGRPIELECFPYSPVVAQYAVEIEFGWQTTDIRHKEPFERCGESWRFRKATNNEARIAKTRRVEQ